MARTKDKRSRDDDTSNTNGFEAVPGAHQYTPSADARAALHHEIKRQISSLPHKEKKKWERKRKRKKEKKYIMYHLMWWRLSDKRQESQG